VKKFLRGECPATNGVTDDDDDDEDDDSDGLMMELIKCNSGSEDQLSGLLNRYRDDFEIEI
jgi:hypothetical protein